MLDKANGNPTKTTSEKGKQKGLTRATNESDRRVMEGLLEWRLHSSQTERYGASYNRTNLVDGRRGKILKFSTDPGADHHLCMGGKGDRSSWSSLYILFTC